MEIKSYVTIVLKRWWLVLLITLAAGLTSIYISRMMPPKFEAETSLRVVTPLGGSLGNVSYQTSYADRLMNTYAQIAGSEQIIDEVKTKLGLKKLPEISVKTIQSSEIIVITVTGNDPKVVAKTANTLANILTTMSPPNANQGNTGSDELKILTERQSALQKELEQARIDQDKLVLVNSQITAKMEILDRAIRLKEADYQNVKNRYQGAVIDEASAIYPVTKAQAQNTKKILEEQINTLDKDLTSLQEQYQALSTSSATYGQQILSARQTLQNKEGAYENLLSQIDSARIANSKLESAQDIMVASVAIAPSRPTGPSSSLIIGLGFLGGLISGVLIAFLINTLDTRILTTEQIQRHTMLPILGRLPTFSRKERKAPWESSDTNLQRAIGNLCTKILTIQRTKQIKTVLVTSPNPREGKSTITIAIAEGLAKSNRKVLVVDADWRKSGLLELLNASPSQCSMPGLLRGDCNLEEAIQVFSNPCVHYLLSELDDEDPISIFHSPAFAELVQKLNAYDLVLFDSPAMLAVPDAYSLATEMDGIILVVQRKRTKMEDIRAMLNQLDDIQTKLLGVIVNRVPLKGVSGYYQRKDYRYPTFIKNLFETKSVWKTQQSQKTATLQDPLRK